MPDWLQAFLLGALQGLTEFLPVSSSGHLVLAQEWLGERFFARDDALLFDLVLHVGTVLPVLWFYRSDLLSMVRAIRPNSGETAGRGPAGWLAASDQRWLAAMIVLGSLPTATIGLAFEDHFESLFSSVTPVCVALLLTAGALAATRWAPASRTGRIGMVAALLIGTVQGLAITPGISRSGSTIAAALFLGIEREQAARFSFLLSLPAILGAVGLKLSDGMDWATVDWLSLGIGFVAAAAVGYGALVFLVGLVKRGGLHRFAGYLVPLAAGAWLFLG